MRSSKDANTRRRKRVGYCVLVFTTIIVLAATLTPSESGGPVDWDQIFCALCGRASLADGLANIVLILPLGVAFGWLGYSPRSALLAAASLSLAVESAQFAIPGRDPSLSDVIFNILGAALGEGLVQLRRPWVHPSARLASRLSLFAAVAVATTFALTDVLFRTTLPKTLYFGGSAFLQSSPAPLRIGANTDPGEHFRGRIDEVRIYKRARTRSEIEIDMNTPTGFGVASPDLVAAYGFDEGSGSILTDVSNHGNAGQIIGATRTAQGRFGDALIFDTAADVVVIPHSPSLDLTSSMTLEAWVNPTIGQSGRRVILQKEYDAYFLLAGSKGRMLTPHGGGTFGWSTEGVNASTAIPADEWTHLAVTYDGTVLKLYVNARLVAHRQRWYPGGDPDVAVNGVAIPPGARIEFWHLREQLLTGAPLRIRALAAAPTLNPVPLVTIHDQFRNEILFLAIEGDDVVFRLRTRAAAARLDSPAIRAKGILNGLAHGAGLALTISRVDRSYCVTVNNRSICGLGFTLGMGWTVLVYSQVSPSWLHPMLGASWMAMLLFPFGFWLRRRWESLLGALVLVTGIVLPCTMGRLDTSLVEIGSAIAGILAGWMCGRRVARAMSTIGTDDEKALA
jgi:hypothetical protein